MLITSSAGGEQIFIKSKFRWKWWEVFGLLVVVRRRVPETGMSYAGRPIAGRKNKTTTGILFGRKRVCCPVLELHRITSKHYHILNET